MIENREPLREPLTPEEWQQRIDEARRKIAAAQARVEYAKHELARVMAERKAKEAKLETGGEQK